MSSERASRTCSTGSRSQAASFCDPAGRRLDQVALRPGLAARRAGRARHAALEQRVDRA